METILCEPEAWLQLIVSSLPIVFFTLDCAGILTLLQGPGLSSLGIAPEQMLGQSVFAIPSIPQIHAHIRCALAGEPRTAIEHIGERTFHVRYAPHAGVDGHMSGVVGIAFDITERNHLPAFSEHHANYRLLIEHIPAITYIAALDDTSSTLYTSPQIESILGFTPFEWMADPTLWLRQVHPDDRAVVFAALRRSQDGEPAPCEYRMLTRDGAVVWFRDESALLRDAHGHPLYLYGVMLNITERKQLEAQLDAARRRLAQSREAERVRLACDLHDGPVQQLLGLGYLLDDSQRRLAQGWQSEAQTIAQSQTLDTIRREVVDIAAQLRAVIGELRPAGLAEFGLAATLEGYVARLLREGGAAGPAIALEMDACPIDLPSDVACCLFRVAQEALRNALKHAHSRQITLSLQHSPAAITLSVRDDGCGFCAPGQLSELALRGHFGLVGLADQVAAAGGRLTICSQVGQGTSLLARFEKHSDGARA